MNAYEREEEALLDAYNRGDIDRATYNREMAQLQRDYREDAHEAAREAYERELDNW